MLVDLIIDGNYILQKNTHTLQKAKLLYGGLHKSLEHSISTYRNMYTFKNVFLVSDSRDKSWRKSIEPDYKATRKRDTEIDWNFVYTAYKEVKEKLPPRVKQLEASSIEGDDWITYLTDKANSEGRSVMIISNDHDIKQKVTTSLTPLYINIMTNEMAYKEKLFLPKNYQTVLLAMSQVPNTNIFKPHKNKEFVRFVEGLKNTREVDIVDNIESLITKLISGDKSDNISCVWKNENGRGIADKGAKTIYDNYIKEFGDIDLDDKDLYENIADLICEKKKLKSDEMVGIVENIKRNVKLIDLRLSNLPNHVIEIMKKEYEKYRK